MNIIEIGMLVCIVMLIVCSIGLKLATDKILDDYERKDQEKQRRLKRWADYSYKQSERIKELETLIKEGGNKK